MLSAVMQRNGKTQTGMFSVQVLAMSLGGAPTVWGFAALEHIYICVLGMFNSERLFCVCNDWYEIDNFPSASKTCDWFLLPLTHWLVIVSDGLEIHNCLEWAKIIITKKIKNQTLLSCKSVKNNYCWIMSTKQNKNEWNINLLWVFHPSLRSYKLLPSY